nr:DNA helicase [Tanacetum cinerariifolium]
MRLDTQGNGLSTSFWNDLWIGDSHLRRNKSSIGRLTYVHPAAGDLFYQKTLLCHQKGCRSFPGIQLRTLLAHILSFCQVSDAVGLWKDTWKSMSEDIPYTSSISLNIPGLHIDDSKLEDYVLYELEGCLNHCSKSLTDFGIRLPPKHLMSVLRNMLLMEEKIYDQRLLAKERDRLLPKLNDKQRHIFNLIINACLNNKQELVFMYGHGGTGKTVLWKTIIYALRSDGKIFLAVTSSSIASLLLPAGRTTHSHFKIPLDPTDTTVGTPDESDPENTSWIDIPEQYCILDDENRISNLINFIYDDDTLHYSSVVKLQEKAIVCPKNDTTDVLELKFFPRFRKGRVHT